MAESNTYSQIHIQCVFAPKFREALINKKWNEQLHKYITGIVQNCHHKMIAINTMPDHLHMLFGMRTHQSLADLMRMVKGDSSEWINKQKLTPVKFKWQDGYGAFSYEKKKIPSIASYIENQELIHHDFFFLDEYINLLTEIEIDYD
jgi:REP element-mobilizing transposase RayT